MKTCARLHEYEGRRCKKCQRIWEAENKDRIIAQRKSNPNTNVSKREWQKRNPDKLWIVKNPDSLKQSIRNWQKSNPNSVKEADKRYRKAHPETKRANNSKRRAFRMGATPKWLSKEQIANMKKIHKEAIELEKMDGLKRHVDHIVPLISDIVCGLHVPWNLQILTAFENCSKANKLVESKDQYCLG